MIKIAELAIIADDFVKTATWDYQIIKSAKESMDLLAKSEDFDIRNEELFNQFESFMNAYRELVKVLGVNPEALDPENFEDAGQLVETLQIRFERIMTNPYLNNDEEWDEDFNPGDLALFLENVVKDAENKIKLVVGEDIDISEMRANQYAAQFNEENFGSPMENKQNEWSAEKIQNAIESRKKSYEQAKLDRKLDPEKFEAFVRARKAKYQAFMDELKKNPEKLKEHRDNLKDRQAKFQNKLKNRIKELEKEMAKALGPTRKAEIQAEIDVIKGQADRNKAVRSKHDKKKMTTQLSKRERAESSDLDKLVATLGTSISNVKMGIKKSITEKLKNSSEHPMFKPYLDKIAAAHNAGNKEEEMAAAKELQKVLNEVGNSDESLVKYNAASEAYMQYRDNVKLAIKQGWLDPEQIEQIKPHLLSLIEQGKDILAKQDVRFKSPNGIVASIVKVLEDKISG